MRPMRTQLYIVALMSVGCAKAGPLDNVDPGFNADAGITVRPDGMTNVPVPDAAPLPDAPSGQQTKTMQQTNDMTVSPSEVGCKYTDPFFGTVLASAENHWYRVFTLADYGITGPFNVQRVSFLTDWALSGTGTSQPATVKVGTYSGTVEADTLDPAMITMINTANIMIPNADATAGQPPPVVTDIAANIPAGSSLIVEIASPDGAGDESIFFLGVTDGGESKKSYISAPGCTAFQTPTKISNIRAGKSALIMVTGTH